MNPAQQQRLLQSAVQLHQQGKLAEAGKLYRQVLASAPRQFDALHLLGALHQQLGQPEEALKSLTLAHAIDRRHTVCQLRLAIALIALCRHTEAEPHLASVLRTEPANADVWAQLGLVHRALGRPAQAIAAFQKTISLRPTFAEPHDLLGAILNETAGPSAARPHFQRAVECDPKFARAWCNLGLVFTHEEKLTDAKRCFTTALDLDPSMAHARLALGHACQQGYELREALQHFEAALAQEPRHFQAHSARLLTLNYLSATTAEELHAAHVNFGQAASAKAERVVPNAPPTRARIRLAFLSPDLRTHSVTSFLEPLLAHIDKTKFEIFLYHDHFVTDATSQRLRSLAEQWRNFAGQPDSIIEKQIRADAPDILVDLAGHTGINRLPLFARRLAPRQVSYLGYPGTTGLREMDLRLTDSIADPEGASDTLHSERLVRFSTCAWAYLPPSDAPMPAPPPCLETGLVTFGSFNNYAKVSDATLALWVQLLEKIPRARLILKSQGFHLPEITSRVRNRFTAAGLAPERYELIGRTDATTSHLALYSRIDIALDPFPYNGTTTTCEALWMGVPVIALHGDRHASRVSASLLSAISHGKWIAANDDDYVRLAGDLAGKPEELRAVRQNLRASMCSSPLLDHVGQSRRFQTALLEAHANLPAAMC